MAQLEKQIENNILSFLEEIGLFCWKNQTTGIFDAKKGIYRRSNNKFHLTGVSDILGLMPDGRFLAIEVKSKNGRISINQMAFITLINSHGGVAFVSRGVGQTFDQLMPFFPQIEQFRHIASKWRQLEDKENQ